MAALCNRPSNAARGDETEREPLTLGWKGHEPRARGTTRPRAGRLSSGRGPRARGACPVPEPLPPPPPALGRRGCAFAAFAALALVALLLAGRGGPRDLEVYPPREASPYLLPWPGGVERLCIQGNNGVVSHYPDEDEFAWDFEMPEGSPVRAARAGVVRRVVDVHDGNGPSAPGNGVHVEHEDGTVAVYWHVRRGGARVTPGQRVTQGALLAESGNVGRSMLPHLHFEVRDARGRSLPVSFRDVPADDRGIPRMLRWYRSGNAP